MQKLAATHNETTRHHLGYRSKAWTTRWPHWPCSRHALAVVAVVALAFGLRLALVQDASVWWDEGLAVWAARQSLSAIADWTSQDVHPPLYFAVLHFWIRLAGDSELAIRFPSVVCGTLTVVALWQLGRRLMPEWPAVALGGALLLATSRFAIWWSQEARMYALVGLLCVLNLLFAARLSQRLRWRDAIGYVAVTAAALWSLYLAAIVLAIDAAIWLAALWTRRAWSERFRAIAARVGLAATAVVLVLPWLVYALPRMRSWSVQVPFDPWRFAELYATLLALGVSTDVTSVRGPVAAVLALAALGVAALLASRRMPRAGALVLLVAVLLPPVAVWVVTTLPREIGYSPKPEARYLLPFAAPHYLLAAAALAAIARLCGRARPLVLVALLAGALALEAGSLSGYYADRLRVDDYQSAAGTLKAYSQPSDLVLLHSDDPWPVFAYHWDREFRGTPHLQDAGGPGVEYFLAPLWGRSEAVWLVVNEDGLRADPQRLYEGWLAARAVASREWRFGTKRVVLFTRTPERTESLDGLAPDDASARPNLFSVEDAVLVGFEQPLRRLRAGDLANVAVRARRGAEPLQLEVLLGESPVARATASVPAGDGIERLTFSLLVPPETPPGRHAWRVRVGERTVDVGAVEVLAGAETGARAAIAPSRAADATFGDPPLARLIGYDVEASAGSERAVAVTLYWEAVNSAPLSRKVFVHLSGPDGRPIAQRDDFPLRGQRPTTTWRAGEVLVDRYDLGVRPDVPSGSYPLRVGFYDPATGERLGPVVGSAGAALPDDQLTLDAVAIR